MLIESPIERTHYVQKEQRLELQFESLSLKKFSVITFRIETRLEELFNTIRIL